MSGVNHKDRFSGTTFVLADGISKTLFDYWNALRRSRPAPDRRDIDPIALGAILPHVFILERHDPDHAVFRLAGTAICSAFGRELRAHNFLSLWEPADRSKIRDLIAAVHIDCRAGALHVVAATLDKREHPCEVLLLPLRGEGTDRLLGSATFGASSVALGWRKLVRLTLLDLASADPATDRIAFDIGSQEMHRLSPPRLAVVNSQPAERLPRTPTLAHPWSDKIRSLIKLDD